MILSDNAYNAGFSVYTYLFKFRTNFTDFKLEKSVLKSVMNMTKFELIFEVVIRYLRPQGGEDIDFEELALFSLGLDDLGVKIFRYLKEKGIATVEEIASTLGANEEDVVNKLDYMYSLGIIDHLGRGYIHRWSLPEAIRRNVIRRITEILEKIAKLAEGGFDER